MLVNATGEPMKAKDDLFVRLLEKTSVITGLLLLGVDTMGVYIIPAIKMFALVLIFMLSIIISFSCLLVPPTKIFNKIYDSLIRPTLLLMGTMVGFTYVMSMFMREGYSSYVGSKTLTLGVTDPTILLISILVVSIIYALLLGSIIMMLLGSIKYHTGATVVSTIGLVSSVGEKLTNTVMNSVKGRDVSRGEGGYQGGKEGGVYANNQGMSGGEGNGESGVNGEGGYDIRDRGLNRGVGMFDVEDKPMYGEDEGITGVRIDDLTRRGNTGVREEVEQRRREAEERVEEYKVEMEKEESGGKKSRFGLGGNVEKGGNKTERELKREATREIEKKK